MASSLRLLVLGGSGFVGNRVVNIAKTRGHEIVALSRRGAPTDSSAPSASVEYVKGDAAKMEDMETVFKQHGPFDGVIHAIGLLFDNKSGFGNYNQYISGSGSVIGEDSSYDRITRQTAFNAIELASKNTPPTSNQKKTPFVFISAAEAGWDFPAPVGKHLHRLSSSSLLSSPLSSLFSSLFSSLLS